MTSRSRPRRLPHILPASTSRWTRLFSSTPRAYQAASSEAASSEAPAESKDALAEREPTREGSFGITYAAWIRTEGPKWKRPDPLGPKWLGGHVPFPLNKTFKPPTPVSDALRTVIYTSYVSDPQQNDPHTLSTRYGIAIKRVEAIIRLKKLEEQWKESKPLQTGFLKGMERLLGLNPGGHMTLIPDETTSSYRAEVNVADEASRQLTEQGRHRKRGISRTFFEPVDEGQEAVAPRLLDEVQQKLHRSRARQSQYPTKVVQPDPTKPAYRFVDVGLRWVDRADVERRQKESQRRKAIKHRKGPFNHTSEQVV